MNSIATYYNDILTVAHQCPFSGGQAVYKARVIVSMFNDTIVYDYSLVCATEGIYKSQTNWMIADQGIKIVPNPATQKAEIILNGYYEGICNLKLRNALGAIQIEKTFNCS